MRKKHSFLLTIIPSEEQTPALRGRVQFIADGTSSTFTNLQELQQLIENQIHSYENADLSSVIQERRSPYTSISPSHWEEGI